jgi:FecR-like protein
MREPDEEGALFSGKGPLPDDLARLRQRLSQLPLPPEPDWGVPRRRQSHAAQWQLVAAAALLVALGGVWLARDAWRVETVTGSPALRGLAFAGRLGLGGTLATDDRSRARLLVTGLGEVELEPGSELRRVYGRGSERRLALYHGTLHAQISAPPRQFVVEAHAAVATDLGCAYTLQVARDGSGRLSVTSGRVAFTDRGHESFVPAGAWCPLEPDGVGVPRRDYASDPFLAALAVYDAHPNTPSALDSVLARAEALDALTLWHLLPRVSPVDRARVAARVAGLIELPADVPMDRVLALDHAALDAWWGALGMGGAGEWRTYKSKRPLGH